MLRPYYLQVVQDKLSPRRLFRHLRRALVEWDHLVQVLPGDLADILERVKRGSFRFHLEHRRLEASIGLLVEGILTAAMILGSSEMLSHKVWPDLYDVSIPGAAGLAVSLFLAWRLFRATRRSKNEP
jgi:ubiquinone biosynthesis protein